MVAILTLAPRHPRELGSLLDDPGGYYDGWSRANGVDRSELDGEVARAYDDARAAFVRGCERWRRRTGRWEQVRCEHRAILEWADVQARRGRRGWLRVPAHVLEAARRAEPEVERNDAHARPRGAGSQRRPTQYAYPRSIRLSRQLSA
jgi:hypothetical protein